MMSKKEKLLERPWINQRYENHRKKVMSAKSAIDMKPPVVYSHVVNKPKKVQRENERLYEIERENVRLLQRLGSIMNHPRLENYWQQPRPNFLSRERMYHTRPKTAPERTDDDYDDEEFEVEEPKRQTSAGVTGSYARCSACNGKPARNYPVVPEERVPWAPTPKSWNYKLVNHPEKPHQCCMYCC